MRKPKRRGPVIRMSGPMQQDLNESSRSGREEEEILISHPFDFKGILKTALLLATEMLNLPTEWFHSSTAGGL